MFDTFNTKGLAGRSATSLYTRRRLLATAEGFSAVSMLPAAGALANVKSLAKHRVLIVGAGVGGATAARYLKMWQPTPTSPSSNEIPCSSVTTAVPNTSPVRFRCPTSQ